MPGSTSGYWSVHGEAVPLHKIGSLLATAVPSSPRELVHRLMLPSITRVRHTITIRNVQLRVSYLDQYNM